MLPGANPVNLAIYVGTQLRGGLGGTVAAIGLIFPPFCLILVLAVLYVQYGAMPLAATLFITVGVLHWPMIPMVLLLAPLSIGVERLLWKAKPQ